MKKFVLLAIFFVGAPVFLLLNILSVMYLSFHARPINNTRLSFNADSTQFAYAALPTSLNIFETQATAEDSRAEIIRQFFARFGSPLEPYAEKVVAAADLYGLDYRLVPAIAMQESNLCKKSPEGSNNCWGFGIYGGNVRTFKNYEEAIEVVTKTLAKDYKEKMGLETPNEIMQRYTPSSNGSWAYSVNHFMEQLQ